MYIYIYIYIYLQNNNLELFQQNKCYPQMCLLFQQNSCYPQRCLVAHLEATLDSSWSEFTCL